MLRVVVYGAIALFLAGVSAGFASSGHWWTSVGVLIGACLMSNRARVEWVRRSVLNELRRHKEEL